MSEAPIYQGEALVKRWGDSSNALRTVTLQLEEGEPLARHPFFGFDGQRVMIVVVPLGNDQQPEPEMVEQSPQQAGGIARAQSLSPERRTEIAKTAAETRWAKPKQKWSELKPSAQAALRIKDRDFQIYTANLTEPKPSPSEDAADEYIKEVCGIKSKRQLDQDRDAESVWRDIDAAYANWLGQQRAQQQHEAYAR